MEKILLNKILSINKLNPKWAIFWDKFLNSFLKKSLTVIKNKKNAAVNKTVFVRKLMFKFLIINRVNIREIIKNKTRYNLFFKSDLTHFSCGPIAIKIRNGIKKGIINFWKNGGPTDIFSEVTTSKNIG